MSRRLVSTLLLLPLLACTATPAPGRPLERSGDEISVCGQLFHTGTPVVLWNDPGGYSAYRATRRFTPVPDGEPTDKQLYGTRTTDDEKLAARVEARGWTLEDLRHVVKQFVIHYDQCGTSLGCFRVLEQRGLSVHFMLDLDGTVYQTLDLKERAWHASQANSAAVGVEVANVGAYTQPVHHILKAWYADDSGGVRVQFPKWIKDSGLRTKGYVPRPARPDILSGTIHGKQYWQYDFTDAQYEALAKLSAALHQVLPAIRLEVPRDTDGSILKRALTPEELADH
ncbi:MAG: N-acetylmuramoyl-L-alanine amidase, partial [Planctomycetes bacterium]|nr:N-acetylmuramoyl-L-alanine amidase [Planctomycetota bacterium]